MSDLEITTAIACFALVLAFFSFFIGSIYNSKQIEKLNEKIDRQTREFNRQLSLLNNSVYDNLENNCRGSIQRRLANLELDKDKHADAINKLARHTDYPKSKIV